MSLVKHDLDMRGMPRRDLVEYFIGLGGKQVGGRTYVFSNWEVELSEESTYTHGPIKIPATLVSFRVEEEDWPKIHKAFQLRFLSAGG